ncbi:hypothetical protein PROFUN_02161 [Planoprotostelium fungivorum]|uniref:Uncharacterized protein n=1 Tax=Planoprotostelium fungivorum TaxID=1890364 RepID=A0A2P6NZA9_9EUKA|nr:hypothetical protein PROFUN_02161 [Planoprotostelium fungivorum]
MPLLSFNLYKSIVSQQKTICKEETTTVANGKRKIAVEALRRHTKRVREMMIPTAPISDVGLQLSALETIAIQNLVCLENERERVEKPVVVHHHIQKLEKEEIQPIIHREREQKEIIQITAPLKETEVKPTTVTQVRLPAEHRPTIVQLAEPLPSLEVVPTTIIEGARHSEEVLPSIVHETIKKSVIQQVTKVLHKDVVQPTLIQRTQPIFERVVEAPIYKTIELPTEELGFISHLPGGMDMTSFEGEAAVVFPGMAHENFRDEKLVIEKMIQTYRGVRVPPSVVQSN